MLQPAIAMLDTHRTMAISTVRPDGWPQTTIVGYANEGWALYFLIFRSSQKFMNIERDNRISIAVGTEPKDLREAKAVCAGAYASEITDESERRNVWKLLVERHTNLADFELPEASETAMMRAICKHVSVVDYTQGLGHTEALTIGGDGVAVEPTGTTDEWGASVAGRKAEAESPD